MRAIRTLCWTLTVVLIVAAPAAATVNTYTDRPTWETDAGTPSAEEDFSGFAVDTPFNPPPTTVAIAVGTIGEIGMTQAFRNLVDVPPLQFTDNNGTNHASCFTNFPDAGAGSETEVEIVLSMPASAFGADFFGVLGGEFLTIEAIEDGTGTVLASLLAPAQDTFMGFVADAGEQIGSIILRSTNQDVGGGGEGFGLDDLAAVFGPQEADLEMVKTSDAGGPVSPGSAVVFTLTVTNLGPATANNVVVTDTFDPAFTYLSDDCGGMFVDPTLTWNVGSLAAMASAVCNVSVTANSSGSNTAVASADNADPVPANNSSTVAVEAVALAIPTLDTVGLVLLVLLLAGLGGLYLRRRAEAGAGR